MIADIPNTWIKQHLDTICHNKIRYWLEISSNDTPDIILLTKAKFGLNVIDVSKSFTSEKNGNIRKWKCKIRISRLKHQLQHTVQ